MLTIKGLEDWYVQTVKLKHGFAGTTPPDPIPLPAVTTIDGLLEGLAEETENTFVAAADYAGKHHTEDIVYKLQLPSKIYRWNGMKAVGGRTIVWNQLMPDGYSKNGNGQTAFAAGGKIIAGHKYYFARKMSASVNVSMYVQANVNGTATSAFSIGNRYTETIGTAVCGGTSDGTATTTNVGNIWVRQNNNGNTCTVTEVMVIDLTTMFGEGNEPSTVAEFKAMFPESYYNYNAGELMDAKVTSIVSKDGYGNTLQTISVPAPVQALTGYGYSTPGKYNYIDYERKKFVQNVGAVDMSDLTFGYGPTVGWSATLPNVKDPADDDTVFNGISDNYTTVSRNTQATAFSGGTDAGMVSVSGGKVYVGTGDISIVPSGTLYYELDTPVETDISEYLTDTDIEYEAGGSITFENTNNIPVHVNVDYIGVHLS